LARLARSPFLVRDKVSPRNLISLAFGGPDKKTLYGVTIRDVQVMSIQMIAQGYRNRPK
jgi:hypothetical protein